jgi:subtilisin family serine protease
MTLMIIGLFSASLFASEQVYYVPEQVLVQVQLNVDLQAENGRVTTSNAALQAVLNEIGATGCEAVFPFDQGGTRFSRTYTLSLAKDANVVDASNKLVKLECVQSVQPNYVYQAHATPTDESYSDQWGLQLIQTASAWDLFTGNNAVTIAVLDTGVDWGHQDLAANIWINTGEIENNNVDDDGNGYVDDRRGWDFTAYLYGRSYVDPEDEEKITTYYFWKPEDNNPGVDDSDPFGLDPHGTHVAGIAGAVGNNSVSGGTNTVGVLWNCNIMALQAGAPWGLESVWITKGLRYAADNGAQVINMSFGGYGGENGVVCEALQYAHEKGVVLCASAGNGYDMRPSYPASLDNVISVAATDENDAKADFSTYNELVDISAPGVEILSTVPNNSYESVGWSGTSMACPFVSGAAGLVIGYGETLGKKFTPAQVEYILEQSADNIDAENPNYLGYLGAGRLNVSNALIVAQNTPAMISSILVRPADDPTAESVAVDEHSTRDFRAIAAYSDGTLDDITDRVIWSVRPMRYGRFSDLVPGRFSALQVPSDREIVIAAYLEDNGYTFSGQRVVTIEDDPEASPLAINGLDEVNPLSSASYLAVYQSPDGTNTDVTGEASWEITAGTEYANFDNAQPGMLLTKSAAAGQTISFKATYVDQTDRRIFTQTKTIQVSDEFQQVAGMYLTAPESLTAGSSVQLTAKLIYAGQDQVKDVTTLSTWSSSPAGAGSFVEPGLFNAGDVSSETTVTLTVQYTTNGQVYTAQLQTKVVPAVAKSALGVTTEADDADSEDSETKDSFLGLTGCTLPGILIMAGLMFGGLVLMRED